MGLPQSLFPAILQNLAEKSHRTAVEEPRANLTSGLAYETMSPLQYCGLITDIELFDIFLNDAEKDS